MLIYMLAAVRFCDGIVQSAWLCRRCFIRCWSKEHGWCHRCERLQ